MWQGYGSTFYLSHEEWVSFIIKWSHSPKRCTHKHTLLLGHFVKHAFWWVEDTLTTIAFCSALTSTGNETGCMQNSLMCHIKRGHVLLCTDTQRQITVRTVMRAVKSGKCVIFNGNYCSIYELDAQKRHSQQGIFRLKCLFWCSIILLRGYFQHSKSNACCPDGSFMHVVQSNGFESSNQISTR